MSRKSFILSHGATCKNWCWSWSFINETERFIIFGAWDRQEQDSITRILSPDWEMTETGRKSSGYRQAREHIRLIEEEGYRLFTFPMKHAYAAGKGGPSKIVRFTPILTPETSSSSPAAAWHSSTAA